MERSRIVVCLFWSVLLAALVLAEPIDVKVTSVVKEVEKGGIAKFALAVTNKFADATIFKISVNPYDVSPFAKEIKEVKITPAQLKIDPGKSNTADIDVLFSDSVSYDREYTVGIKVTSLLNPTLYIMVPVTASIINPKDIIQVTPKVPATAVPGEEFAYAIDLINRLNARLEGYTLTISSEVQQLNTEESLVFQPKEKITKEYSQLIGINTQPGAYTLRIGVYKDGAPKGLHAAAYKVMEKPIIEEKKDETKSFLKATVRISKKNTGNTASKQKIEMATSAVKNLFTTTSLEPKYEKGKLVWEFTLQPQDEFGLEITINYRSIFYGIVAIVIATLLIVLYVDRSVTLKKRMLRVRITESGISELKVVLHVRNGTLKMLEHIRIIDLIPNTAELIHDFGTLKPEKIQQGQHNMRLIWDILHIAPHEERVIMYRVKAKLPLAGQVILPWASLHYMSGTELISVRSAPLTFRSTGI